MDENFYFTYWISRHGRNNFLTILNQICSNVTVPKEIPETNKADYLYQYFYASYLVLALKNFGLKTNEISFVLDMCLVPGVSNLYPVKYILKKHQDMIPDIKKYIEKDLKLYD